MIAARRIAFAALACAGTLAARPGRADTTTLEVVDGVQYQVTRRTMQVPMTQTSDQQQTVYRQQLTTQTLQHQQLYTVPVTQYQLVSQLHGRFNPFITPYWTHHYEPVTTWQQQTATVQIPVSSMAWVPETRTVQAQTTTYRPVEAIVSRIPLRVLPAGEGSQQMMASTNGPTATLAARPPATTASAPITAGSPAIARAPAAASAPAVASAPAPSYGGQALTSDPPRQATGWQAPSDSRYR